MTSSTFRSRSYKIKEPSAVENTLEKDESTVGSNESPCHSPSTTRVSWKTLKIFSRTLSSIEKIRTTKNNNQTNNSNDPSPISPTRPAVIVTATGDSAISTLAPILKSSSRHLQHEVNSYIIKDESPSSSLGLETSSSVTRSRQGNSKAASEWKVLKNKLSSLRKRSSGSTSGSGSGVADESSNASVTPGPGDESESSGRRLSSNSRTGSARTSRSGSQDEGIVCKREDLINLLTEATKVASVSPPILTSATSPTSATTSSPFSTSPSTSSPTTTNKTSIIKSDSSGGANVSPTPIGPRKVILKTSPTSSATIQLSDQQPIDPTRKLIKKSVLKKNLSADSNNSSNSNNNNNNSRPCSAAESLTNESLGFVETRIVVPGKPSLKFDLSHDREPSKSRSSRAIQFNCDINNNPRNSELNSSLQVSPSATQTLTELDVNLDKNVPNESPDNQDDSESPSSSSAVAAVKWDESNVVDAMMLGDAIQAFLKGMEASVQKPTEKRVLFKKQS